MFNMSTISRKKIAGTIGNVLELLEGPKFQITKAHNKSKSSSFNPTLQTVHNQSLLWQEGRSKQVILTHLLLLTCFPPPPHTQRCT